MSNVQCAMCNSRPMKDSGIEWIGEIPESWGIKVAFQLFSQVKCKNEGLVENNLLSLSYGKIKRKSIETVGGLLPESFDGYNIIEKNDIVLRLTDLQNDHTSLRVGLSNERGIVTSAYITLRPTQENHPKYLYYFLHSFDICKGFYGMGAGVRQGLNWDGLKLLKFIVPPIDEQERIAEFLDKKCGEIDEVIAKTEKTIEEYKALKQSVITEAVTKGIRLNRPMKDSGIEWIGQIPEDSSIYRLKHLLKSPLLYGANESGVPFDEKLPRYIRITDISMDGNLKDYGKLSLTEEMAQGYILEDNDILFARSGATVGKAFIYKKEYGLSAFAGYLIKASLNEEKVIPQYLFLYTQSSLYEEWKKQIFVQATIQNIGADRYSSLPVVLPSILIQEEIVNYLNSKCKEIDKLIEVKQQLLIELEAYKKSVIYEYVTGKKEVRF